MINILVTGSNGQLGNELKDLSVAFSQYKFHFTDVDDLDITNRESIEAYFKNKRISYVINCAAYTAVDQAEEEKELAFLVNATAPGLLASVANQYNAHIVQISTDFVFDGRKNTPYNESDVPNPRSVYAKSKLEGEKNVAENCSKYTIIRTSWLYSPYGNNFVKSMMKYGRERGNLNVVFDQVGSPTRAFDLAKVIMEVIKQNAQGIFHYSNEGVLSWYDFARAIIDLAGIYCKVSPIPTSGYPLPAERPAYSVLNKAKIKKDLKIVIPYWRDGLVDCMSKLRIQLKALSA